MLPPTQMSKTDRKHTSYYLDAMRMIEHDLHDVCLDLKGVPPEWHRIAQNPYPTHPKKTPVTLRVDADVVRAFKAMGQGYQTRMNRVLRAWMLGRVAKIIDGPDTTDYILHPERIEDDQKLPRPEWGDTEALLERISKSLRGSDGDE